MWIFQAELDQKFKCYRSGDEVRGKVTFKGTGPPKPGEEDAPVTVTVALWGRTKTKLNEYDNSNYTWSTYRGRADLFRETKIVFQDRANYRGNNVYAFSLPFPVTSPITAVGTQNAKQFPANHPLPPSMKIEHDGHTKQWECFVEYKLIASFVQGSTRTEIVSEHSIGFLPTAEALSRVEYEALPSDPLPATQVIRSPLLDPANQGRDLGFREKARLALHRSDVPQHKFRVHISHPTSLILGSAIGCKIKLVHLPRESTAPQIPSIMLGSTTVELVAVTFAATEGIFSDHNVDESRMVHQFQLNPARNFTAEEGWEKTLTSPDMLKKSEALPTFATFNIRRAYFLKINATIWCCEKSFEVEKKTDVFVLLPPETGTQVLRPSQPIGNNSTNDETLPAYEP